MQLLKEKETPSKTMEPECSGLASHQGDLSALVSALDFIVTPAPPRPSRLRSWGQHLTPRLGGKFRAGVGKRELDLPQGPEGARHTLSISSALWVFFSW